MSAVVMGAVAAGEIAAGLRSRGVAAHVLDAAAPHTPALEDLERAHGPLSSFVWAADPPQAQPVEIGDLPPDEWVRLGQQPLRDFFRWCQAVSGALAGRPSGRVLLVVPSVALSGAPGLVAWTTAADGQRSLAKALARAWGKRNVTVNVVAVPAATLTRRGGAGAAAGLDRPGLQPLSLPALPSLREEVAGVIASLLEPAWGAVTGATIAVDGGQWMPS